MRRRGCLCALAALCVLAAAAYPGGTTSAQQALGERVAGGAALLNSDRIEAAFGSYGIDVLASDMRIRVSDLYSTDDGERTTRTFAVVAYPAEVDAAFAGAHAEILGGGSIGATLRAHGWLVVKQHRYFGEIPSSPRVERMMRLGGRTRLALHIYELEIVKGATRFHYAAIAEIHHPDYLTRRGIIEIYAPAWRDAESEDLGLVAEMVAIAAAEMQ